MADSVMKWRVECLTPLLVGDGRKLSPIDYMVWRDQVNVLDQMRIFRLLARGPRLEGYLTQLRRADKLDFSSWGGFAQNYSERRIPFESVGMTAVWNSARAENLFIPTFATGPHGPYLPATAVKGALRTGLVHTRATGETASHLAAKVSAEGRVSRSLTASFEDSAVGGGGSDELRTISAGDSGPVNRDVFRVYLLRVSTLERRGEGRYEPAWKTSPRGTVRRAEDATPLFAEMASPGAVFTGEWHESEFLRSPEVRGALHRRPRRPLAEMFRAVNEYASKIVRLHANYAEQAGMPHLKAAMAAVEEHATADLAGNACVLPLGWGASFLSKTAFTNTEDPSYRSILRTIPFYARAVDSGLPFPKTRKIVFLDGQPATIPGFVKLSVE